MKSTAHKYDMNMLGKQMFPDGLVDWEDRNGSRHCGYCGSMHPTDVAAAIAGGAIGHFADRKYGWPHKIYLEAPGLYGKFYTAHLQDATDAEKAAIEQHLGTTFEFSDDSVGWKPVNEK